MSAHYQYDLDATSIVFQLLSETGFTIMGTD